MKNSKLVSIILALAIGAASSGCIGSMSYALGGSDAASMHFIGTVTTPGGPWGADGQIQVCYKFSVIGGSDIEGCEPYTMQVPGMINLDKDITHLRDAHGITTAQSTYLIINGTRYPGTILSTDISHRNINGLRDTLVSVSAYYQLPATLATRANFSSPLDAAHSSMALLEGRRPAGLPASVTGATLPGADGVGAGIGSAVGNAVSGEAHI